jgi:hypothetical protein
LPSSCGQADPPTLRHSETTTTTPFGAPNASPGQTGRALSNPYRGVGRDRGAGRGLGVGVSLGVAVGVGVALGVTLSVGVGVGVDVTETMAYA